MISNVNLSQDHRDFGQLSEGVIEQFDPYEEGTVWPAMQFRETIEGSGNLMVRRNT
jgi:hypothetical protein